jgi:hypothetical protein
MTSFAVAVERKQWQIVTYRLLLAISDAAHKLPPESLNALLDLLSSEREPEGRRDR